MTFKNLGNLTKRVWLGNLALAGAFVFMIFGDSMYMASVVSINEKRAKSFDGAIYPLAFVPNWRVGNYIEDRAGLRATEVAKNDYIPLPDPEDIHDDFNAHFTFMNLHLGAYMDEDRVRGAGSHVGVDIRAPIDTPIFSIANGVVWRVKDFKDDKYVVVKHKNIDYQGVVGDYYSGYLHLGKVYVEPGDLVNKGTVVGTVGMTGITTTPHLHFQIDNDEAPFHPYWPFTLSEAYSANLNFFEAVNKGLNQSNVRSYTVDPIHFLKYAEPADGKASKKTPQQIADEIVRGGSKTRDDERTNAKEIKEREEKEKKERQEEEERRKEQERIEQEEKERQEAEKKKWDDKKKEEERVKTIEEMTDDEFFGRADEFPDLPRDHPYYGPIKYFVSKGVLNGYEDGSFGPDKTLTRSELLAVVLNALKLENEGEMLIGIFQDVPVDHWVNPLISNAVNRGIITTDRKVFEPNREVTRAEFLAILVFAGMVDFDVDRIKKSYKDVDINHWSSKYAKIAYDLKLFTDISGSKFGPDNSVQRGEVAYAMFHYLQKTRDKRR